MQGRAVGKEGQRGDHQGSSSAGWVWQVWKDGTLLLLATHTIVAYAAGSPAG